MEEVRLLRYYPEPFGWGAESLTMLSAALPVVRGR